jgi:formylglycine-generating enzyme
MNHYSDMTEGVESFKEAQKRWKQRLQTERKAWTAEKEQYLQLLEEGQYEAFASLLLDDPVLFSSFFSFRRGELQWHVLSQFPLKGLKTFWDTIIDGEIPIAWAETNLFDSMILWNYQDRPVSRLSKRERNVLLNISMQQTYLFTDKTDRYTEGQGRGKRIPNLMVGRYEVTQVLWDEVFKGTDRRTPSHFKGATRPVESVSWEECLVFCNRLSSQAGLKQCYEGTGEGTWKWNRKANGYRLPTTEEWTLAAQGEEDFTYAGSDNIDAVAWYKDNSDGKTHAVGQLKMNGIQTFDMSGNVNEWTWTHEGRRARVFRGGCWFGYARSARVSYRNWYYASFRFFNFGFRFVRNMGKED